MTVDALSAVKTGSYVGPINRINNGEVVETLGYLYKGKDLAGSSAVPTYVAERRLDPRRRFEKVILAFSPREDDKSGFRGTFDRIIDKLSLRETAHDSPEVEVGIATESSRRNHDVPPELVEGALRLAMAREAVQVAHLADASNVNPELVEAVGFEPEPAGDLVYARANPPSARPTLAFQ